MSLDKMLAYQQTDRLIFKEELALLKGNENQKISALAAQVNGAQNTLLKLDKETETLLSATQKLEKDIEKLIANNKGIFAVSGLCNAEQIEESEADLKEYGYALQNYEKEHRKIFKRLNEIAGETAKMFEIGRLATHERNKLNEARNNQIKDMRTKLEKEYKELETLKTQIEPKIFALYESLRNQRKMPAFVAYDKANGACPACGVVIKIEVEHKLKAKGDMTECPNPNCHRVVYLDN
jgi:predicted  nucleic acid-binding Zn-ribbon protein